jgi:hypothetical protein
MQGQALSLETTEVAVESEQLEATVGRFTMHKRTTEASPTRITHIQGVSGRLIRFTSSQRNKLQCA